MPITVREVSIDEALRVHSTITEFAKHYTKEYFEGRYGDKEKLIIIAYLDEQPAGYLLGYNRYEDGSFYCAMAGVSPAFRKRGVLKALMDRQGQWARGKGYSKLKIKTRNNRREMLHYLVKYGFNFTEISPRKKIGNYRISLEKDL